jgi:phosphoglycerol transferase MdoB-like AlkP superfamily enzyme
LPVLGFVACLTAISIHWHTHSDSGIWLMILRSQIEQAPFYALYGISTLLVPSWIGALTILSFALILNIADHFKNSMTLEVLNFHDLVDVEQFRVVTDYLSLIHYVLLIGFVLLISFALFYAIKRIKRPTFDLGYVSKVIITLFVGYFSFYPFFLGKTYRLKTDRWLEKVGVKYRPWNWNLNRNVNGLYFHLVQTSVKKIPPSLSANDRARYEQIEALNQPKLDGPKHIIFVLCEACWFDDENFKEEFEPLLHSGFLRTTVTSPSYGGRTVNAAFEMLTSLSAKALSGSGVVYPDYANSFSKNAKTLVRGLRDMGYETFSFHNYFRAFWRRNVVLPKFGFTQYDSVESMSCERDTYPRDDCVFERALQVFKERRDRRTFMNIETVYTHGHYHYDHDHGENHYRKKLKETIAAFRRFADQVLAVDPDVLIVMYGDHKPALTKYLYDRGVFPASLFRKTGDADNEFVFVKSPDNQILGRVPMFILAPKYSKQAERIVRRITERPLYCVSSILDEELVHTHYLGTKIAQEACNQQGLTYDEQYKKIPPSVYAYLLFDPK